jgi:hypothetical protein
MYVPIRIGEFTAAAQRARKKFLEKTLYAFYALL